MRRRTDDKVALAWVLSAACAASCGGEEADLEAVQAAPAWDAAPGDAALADAGGGGGPRSDAGGEAMAQDAPADRGDGDSTAPAPDAPAAEAGSGPAYLHADVWSTWWNDRTRCGAERAFLEICQRRAAADCSLYQQAYAACDPKKIVYGQVGPEKQGEPLCQQSKFPDVGGCIAASYDFAKLRFYWYGAEWQGNWPVATLKVFPKGVDWKGGGEVIALSNVPGAAQAAMSGIQNHGLGHGCAMLGATSGNDKYRKPFGGFAWVEVPVGTPVTVASVAATNFANQPFQGCSRGAATQQPWITSAPDAQLGCVYVLENVVFEAGKHYALRYGKIEPLAQPAPPKEIVDGFALPEVGLDVHVKDKCKL
jgi:hypothetical protein